MTQSTPPGDDVEPFSSQSTLSWLSTRSRRILAVAIVVAIVATLGVVLFSQFAPDSTVGASPTVPSAPGNATQSPSGTATSQAPNDSQVVPDVTPIDIEDPGAIKEGLTVQVTAVEAVDGTARGPGEVAGASVRITVTVINTSSAELTLRTAVVSCYFGPDRTPAQELREPGGRPLPELITANSAVDGVYIFTVPPDQRSDVTLLVDYSVDVVPVLFHGDLSELISS